IEERMVFGRGFLAPSIQYIKIPSGKHPSIRLQMEMPRDRIAHVFSFDRYVFDEEILEGKPKTFKVIFGIDQGHKISLERKKSVQVKNRSVSVNLVGGRS